MKTAGKFLIVLVGLTFSLAGVLSSCAQGSYGQPGYGQTQPGYNQPGYDNGYSDQPGYTNQQGYNNQPGYNQYSGQPQDFYNELGPYGQWVQTPQYGTVWIPNVQQGFQPYATNGHWVVTEYGNTWVSDYAWGWGPFHYGRWYQDPRMGWAWVPGYDWGPAWVSWRSGGGYYGWAPLGPGINVNVNIPANYWVFVPQLYITSQTLYSYYVPRPRVVNIYQQTTIINNVYRANNRTYAYGPRRDEIERVTRQSVPVYRIENSGRAGRDVVGNNSVGFYRPDVNRGNSRNGNESRSYNAPFDNNRGSSRDDSRGNNVPGRTSGGYYGGSSRGDSRDNNVPPTSAPTPTPGSYNGSGRGNAGTYGDPGTRTYPTNPTPAPSTSDRGSSRGGSYGRPNYESQQNQPMPQPSQPTQPARPEATPQPQREWGGQRGGGNYSPQPQATPAPASPQPQRGGSENRAQPQPQPSGGREQRGGNEQPQGGYSSGRGSSRGNN